MSRPGEWKKIGALVDDDDNVLSAFAVVDAKHIQREISARCGKLVDRIQIGLPAAVLEAEQLLAALRTRS